MPTSCSRLGSYLDIDIALLHSRCSFRHIEARATRRLRGCISSRHFLLRTRLQRYRQFHTQAMPSILGGTNEVTLSVTDEL